MDGELIADGTEGVPTLLALALDLRRLRLIIRLKRLVVVTEPEVSVSELLDELVSLEDDEEPSMSAKTPGCDSS